jgi:prophage antirepressor-like protein
MDIYKTMDNHYVLCGDDKIIVVVDDDCRIWFSLSDILDITQFKDDIDKKYIKKYKHLNINNNFNNNQTLFISETGLFFLIKSDLAKYDFLADWYCFTVPVIGKYPLHKQKQLHDKQLKILNGIIDSYNKKN